MRNRQEILGEVFGDLEKSFERGVIDILCAEDRPDPEALVVAIKDHTLRRVGSPAGAPSEDAIDVIIDALELCYYHRECATFRSALERAKMLRVRPSDLHGRSLKDIDLLSPEDACRTQWRDNARQQRRKRKGSEPESGSSENASAEDGSKRGGILYPLTLRTLGRT